MKTKLALSALVAAVAVFSQGAFAQASSPTRAEVKVQAKSSTGAPTGEAANAPEKNVTSTKSTKTRAERKAETKMARDAGTLKPAGEAAGIKSGTPSAGSDTTRADRKATTKAAAKAGGLQPAGEAGSQQAGEAPKK